MLFKFAPVAKEMRDLLARAGINDVRMQSQSVVAAQEIMQQMTTKVWDACNNSAIHGKRITVVPKDIRHAVTLAKIFDVPSFLNVRPDQF